MERVSGSVSATTDFCSEVPRAEAEADIVKATAPASLTLGYYRDAAIMFQHRKLDLLHGAVSLVTELREHVFLLHAQLIQSLLLPLAFFEEHYGRSLRNPADDRPPQLAVRDQEMGAREGAYGRDGAGDRMIASDNGLHSDPAKYKYQYHVQWRGRPHHPPGGNPED
jgi:hypothetical protein